MATRNRTLLFRKYRNSLRSVRAPLSSSSLTGTRSGGVGPVIEMASTSLLNPNRSYAPISTEDPGTSRYSSLSLSVKMVNNLIN
jgi:syntaxin 16